MAKLITPLNASADGYYHSANGAVKRVFDTNALGQLVEVTFTHQPCRGSGTAIDRAVFKPNNRPIGQVYAQTKLGK